MTLKSMCVTRRGDPEWGLGQHKSKPSVVELLNKIEKLKLDSKPRLLNPVSNLFQLYRHFNDQGELLYVGMSLSTVARLMEHRCNSHWFYDIVNIKIEYFPDMESVLKAETLAIKMEKPLHNIMHNRKRGI